MQIIRYTCYPKSIFLTFSRGKSTLCTAVDIYIYLSVEKRRSWRERMGLLKRIRFLGNSCATAGNVLGQIDYKPSTGSQAVRQEGT